MPFETTRWSLVNAAGGDDSAARAALARLCEIYWYPLYAYVRRRGSDPDDARDLTQGFLASLLEHRSFENLKQERGRFRAFLLASLKHFLANETAKRMTQKRGGNVTLIPIAFEEAEGRYRAEPAEPATPQTLYERRWALTVIESVLAELRKEWQDAGRAARTLSMATGTTEPLPIPLSARALLERLRGTKPPPLAEARAQLLAIAAAPDDVQRWRRAIPVALAATPTLALILAALLILPPLFTFMTQHAEMLSLLERLRQPPPGSRVSEPEFRDALERYVAGTYGAVLRDESFWESLVVQRLPLRETAEGILERHPSVSEQELAEAAALVGPAVQRAGRERNPQNFFSGATVIVVALAALSLLVVTGAGIVSSAIAPGGLLTRFLGLAVVTRSGEEITRGRSLLRAVIAWLPGIVWLGYLATGPKIQGFVPAPTSPWPGMTVALGLLATGAIWAVIRPSRGLHDRLVGIWVVPR